MLRIGLYIGSWPQNIGNSFFDLGAKALLRDAFPDATFYPLGGAVHWLFNHSQVPGKFLANSIELGEFAEVDVLVFAGMSVNNEFIKNNGRTLINASRRGVAILGLGAGAYEYTDSEARKYAEFLHRLNRVAIITRDDDTYSMLKGYAQHIMPGIDCAFALPRFYTPPHLDLPSFDVVTFDRTLPPESIDHQGRDVIFAHHDLWGPLPEHYVNKPRTLVSDVPEDYFTLYSNATVVYSDRVHACVAALAYGKKTKLYNKTNRKSLFKKLQIPDINDKICTINIEVLAKLYAIQIVNTRKLISDLLSR